MDLIKSFVRRVDSEKSYFSFSFITSYSHDYLTLPGGYDEYLKATIESLETEGYLDKTLFILFSDHGPRLTTYATTDDGKLERNYPFLSMRLPSVMWQSKYFENARRNRRKLISHFDVYKSLKHFYYMNKHDRLLFSPSGDEAKKCREYFEKSDPKVRSLRGVSIFENIPLERKCDDAIISIKYCSCNKQTVLKKDAKFMAEHGMNFKY